MQATVTFPSGVGPDATCVKVTCRNAADAVAMMRQHADNCAAQRAGCKLLLSDDNAKLRESAERVVAAGAIPTLVAAMRRHAAEAELLCQCGLVLCHLATSSDASQQRAVLDAGALDLAVQAARAFPDSRLLPSLAVALAASVAIHNVVPPPAVISAGGLQLALDVLQLPSGEAYLDRLPSGLKLLSVLVRVPELRTRAICQGAFRLVEKAMHAALPLKLLLPAWEAFFALLQGADAADAALAGKTPVLETAMLQLEHGSSADSAAVRGVALRIIGVLFVFKQAVLRPQRAGRAILHAMGGSPLDLGVLLPACGLLSALCGCNGLQLPAALRLEITAAVEAARRVAVGCALIQERSAHVLKSLQTMGAADEAAADAAMAELLAEEEAERAATRLAAPKRKQKKKAGGAAPEAAAGPAGASGSRAGAVTAAMPLAPPPCAVPVLAAVAEADFAAALPDAQLADAATASAAASERAGADAAAADRVAMQSAPQTAAQQPPLPPSAAPAARRAPRPYRPPTGLAAAAPSSSSLLPPVAAASAAASLLPPLASLSLAASTASLQPAPPSVLLALPQAAPPPPPPPPPTVMKECCMCFLDVPQTELLLLAPCGHRCVCAECAAQLMDAAPAARLCPSCRTAVLCATRVFDL